MKAVLARFYCSAGPCFRLKDEMHVLREARNLFIFIWIAGFCVSILILTYAFVFHREYVHVPVFRNRTQIAHSIQHRMVNAHFFRPK